MPAINNKAPQYAAIVDDEPSCRFSLKSHVRELLPEVEIVFEADGLESTRNALKEHRIDLIFLDVQLKDGNAFELLDELDETTRVVFTTSYDSYAVRAFEVNALDYLLKPVQKDRLERALQMFTDGAKRDKTLPMIRPDDDVLLNDEGISRFVAIADIVYIQSDKDYTHVVTASKKYFVRRSIASWEEQLPLSLFIRIHRSYLINEKHVAEIKKASAGRYEILMRGIEKPVFSSRRYSSRLKRLLS